MTREGAGPNASPAGAGRVGAAPDGALPARRLLALLALLLAAIWLGNLDYRRLIRPDEGRYAEIAREMAVTGDWVTPRLNGIKYFEKPPLQYWATAAAYRAFGQHEWTTRLWPALAGLGGIALVCFAAGRLFGRDAGFYAGTVLAGTGGYIFAGHFNTLDMGASVFMTATILALLLAQRAGAGRSERRGWMLAAWAAAGLAVLSKGLIGVVLPAGTLAVYMALQRDASPLRRLEWTAGLAVFLAVVLPWFVLVQAANPEFGRFFFVHEHLERFLTKVHHRPGPWWYYAPVLAAVMLPWVSLLPQALARGWRQASNAPSGVDPARFLVIWSAFTFLFFSASGSKLPSYILPVVPALAILIGTHAARAAVQSLSWHMLPMLVAGATIAAFAPMLMNIAGRSGPAVLYEAYLPWIVTSGIVVMACSAVAAYYCRRLNKVGAMIVMAGGCLIGTQIGTSGHEALSSWYSGYGLAQSLKPRITDDVPLYSVSTYDQSLPFYIGRTVTLVAFRDELDFGLQSEPWRWLPDLDAFELAWRRQPGALAIVEPATYDLLASRGVPMEIVARDLRRIVVRNPGAAN